MISHVCSRNHDKVHSIPYNLFVDLLILSLALLNFYPQAIAVLAEKATFLTRAEFAYDVLACTPDASVHPSDIGLVLDDLVLEGLTSADTCLVTLQCESSGGQFLNVTKSCLVCHFKSCVDLCLISVSCLLIVCI